MTPKFCTNCGNKLPEGAKFCTKCGKQLAAVTATAAASPPPPPPKPAAPKPAAPPPPPPPPAAKKPDADPPPSEPPSPPPKIKPENMPGVKSTKKKREVAEHTVESAIQFHIAKGYAPNVAEHVVKTMMNSGQTPTQIVDNWAVMEESQSKEPEFFYVVNGNAVTIVNFKGKELDSVEIPSHIEDLPVTEIGREAFRIENYFSSITIPPTVVSIGERAFSYNEKLKEIVIPDSVKTIGKEAFEKCEWLQKLVIGNGVTEIGEEAFRDCKRLASIKFGSGLKTIGKKAFDGCAPDELVIPDSIKDVEGLPVIEKKEEAVRRSGGTSTVNLSDTNPPAAGDGWTFKDDIYTVMTHANVIFTGSTKGSSRRIVVAPEAKNVEITLDNVTIDLGKYSTEYRHSKGKLKPCPILIEGKTEVTITLTGANKLKTETGYACIEAAEKSELTVKGSGSLDASSGNYVMVLRVLTIAGGTFNLFPESKGYGLTANELTMYGGKINIVQTQYTSGMRVSKGRYDGRGFLTVHGGEIAIAPGGKVKQCDYFGINCDNIIVNGGSVLVKDGNWGISVKYLTVNGGAVEANAIGGCAAIGAPRIDSKEQAAGIGLLVTVNGGKVTATVPPPKFRGENPRAPAAIGRNSGANAEDHAKLVVNGGSVDVSTLDAYSFEEHNDSWIKTVIRTDTEFNGGTVIEGGKQIFSAKDLPVEVTAQQYSEKARLSAVPTKEREGYAVFDGIEMMRVRAGTFTMGASDDGDESRDEDEKPAHKVTLTKDYYIGVYPVTQKQWTEVMGSNPSEYRGDDLPVTNVNFFAAQEFIKKLNEKTGKEFRLPTEAEWEFAARGGNESLGFTYAGSNDINDVAWWGENSGKSRSDRKPQPVGTKIFNELGIYDMSGNVLEWVADVENKYTVEDQVDPTGPEPEYSTGKRKLLFSENELTPDDVAACRSNYMMRGGSWDSTFESSCTVYARTGRNPNRQEKSDYGFRLAMTA